MKRLLLFITTLLCANVLLAQTRFWIDSLRYEVTSAIPAEVEVYDANDSITIANIPSIVNYGGRTYSVTSIGDYAFFDCSSLTSVTIPDSVTSIGIEAFEYCSSLTSLTIPNSVTYIGDAAFYRCSSLTSVSIPNSVTSIGEYAFYLCDNLTSVTIGNSVTSIGSYAFEFCSSLTSVTCLKETAPSLADYSVFYATPSTKVLNIPCGSDYSSWESATTWASVECIDVYLGNDLTYFPLTFEIISEGERTMKVIDCDASATVVEIPARVMYNGVNYSVTSIGMWAFSSCISLTSVTIPNTVTSIGVWAFNECRSLTSVAIPNSVTSIGKRAFFGCYSLDSVICLAETAPSLGESVFAYTPSTKVLNIPFGSDYSSWQGATDWSKTNYLIQEGKTKELSNDFTINSTTSLINEGVLRIKQSGQLINQTETNVGGIIEIEATNLPNNWNYIGAPFNNYALGAIKPQTNDVSVSTFNHISGQWDTTWATYQTEIPTGEHFAAWNFGENPIVFTTYGDLYNYETESVGEYDYQTPPAYTLYNDSTLTITHTDNNTTDNENWLAVSNPYTHKLKVSEIINQNTLQGNGLYKYNGTTFALITGGDIQVTEGFFVNTTTLTLNKNQRITTTAKTSKQKDYIRLLMQDGENEIELLFAQNDKANAKYDIFDANKLFSPLEITEPYFVTEGVALVKEEVNTLPYTANLNIRNYENKEVTISIDNIPEGVTVFLLDNGQDIKMNGGVEYTTTITAGENADRFQLLVKKQQKIERNTNNQITIKNNNRQITITSDITNLNIEVYNNLGQKVFATKDYNFTLDQLSAGSYVVKAFYGRVNQSQKIVIE